MTPQSIEDELQNLATEGQEKIGLARDSGAIEEWRINFLGRRGRLAQVMRGLGSLVPEERRLAGAKANEVKSLLEKLLSGAQQLIEEQYAARKTPDNSLDVTLPGRLPAIGRLHPVTSIVREVCSAFAALGFDIVEGPEVEWEHYNFDLLNIPRNHPARDMWDTLWIDWTDPTDRERRMLLRTHTSPMQARIMEDRVAKSRILGDFPPPVRVVVPGKCFRFEAVDATHEWHFYQIEGLAVDEGITFSDLKGTLYEFARRIFGADRQIRFRCDYFPFVEPGVDVSIDCFLCKGKGCRVCKETGWIEIMGAGMVHPSVLEGVGYDSSVYTGFAFGMGPERIAMLKHGIDDIRHFYANDMRFLRQF